MAKFIGKGLLEPYSNEIVLTEPVTTYSLKFLLRLPEDLSENIIAVRDSRKLNDGDLIYNDDDIILFLATLGG